MPILKWLHWVKPFFRVVLCVPIFAAGVLPLTILKCFGRLGKMRKTICSFSANICDWRPPSHFVGQVNFERVWKWGNFFALCLQIFASSGPGLIECFVIFWKILEGLKNVKNYLFFVCKYLRPAASLSLCGSSSPTRLQLHFRVAACSFNSCCSYGVCTNSSEKYDISNLRNTSFHVTNIMTWYYKSDKSNMGNISLRLQQQLQVLHK